MKILVLGDSHTAAVKYGWDQIAPDHPDIHLDFFALPKRRMRTLKAQGKRIMMAPRAGPGDKQRFAAQFPAEELDATTYDAIFLVGFLEAGESLVRANFRTRLPSQMGKGRRGFLGLRRKKPTTLLAHETLGTPAMFRAAFEGVFDHAVGSYMLKQMNKLGRPPVYWAINPMLSTNVLKVGHPLRPQYSTMIASGNVADLQALAHEVVAQHLPAHVTLIPQPQETIHEGCLTKHKYMAAAKTFYQDNRQFGKRDVQHANADYGVLLLQDLFGRLTQEPQT